MLLILIFLLLAGIWYVLAEVGKHIIFRPHRKCWPMKLPFTSVQAGPLSGVYLPAQAGRPTLLFFHGRGGNVSHFESFALAYAPLGYGILMFDYRGFGRSSGVPAQKHIAQDAVAAVQYALNQLKIPAENLVIYGHSLGNFPALVAAQHFKHLPLKALVLQSPFLSAPDVAAGWVAHGYQPTRFLYRFVRAFVTPFLWFNRFDNTQLTHDLSLPVLVCFSKADVTLPWQQSAKLADGLPHAKRFLSAIGGHDEFGWAAPTVDLFLQGKPY